MYSQKAGFQQIEINGGMVPLFVPNDVIDGEGFYVSYNDRDISSYGCATTALVIGQMEAFYILNGNHVAAYVPLIEGGFDACMAYFEANIDLINKRSDKPGIKATGLGL